MLFVNQSLTVFSQECCEDEEASPAGRTHALPVNEGCDTPQPKENSSTVGHTGRKFPLDFFSSLCVRNKAGGTGARTGECSNAGQNAGLLN